MRRLGNVKDHSALFCKGPAAKVTWDVLGSSLTELKKERIKAPFYQPSHSFKRLSITLANMKCHGAMSKLGSFGLRSTEAWGKNPCNRETVRTEE